MASGDLTGRIDSWLKNYGSPMAGLGSVYVAAGRKYGVDPRLPVAISAAESSAGKHPLGSFNAWGWGPGITFNSWENGISTVTKGLHDGYISQGLRTPAAIVSKWAPASDGNDEQHWSQLVSQFMRELGAAPGLSTPKVVSRPSSPPSAKVPGGARLVAATTTAPLNLQPLRYTPTNAGLQSALISNLQQIGIRGHGSGTDLLQGVLQGALSDQQANEAGQAQVNLYNDAIKKLLVQQPTSQPTTVPVPGTDASVPAPSHKQPPAKSDTPPSIPATKGTSAVVNAAAKWLGTDYSWGGGGPAGPSFGFNQGAGIKGFDCSSLLQYAYAQVGVAIPRVTYDQWNRGQSVARDQLRPGDAVFFNMSSRGPEHVGIFMGQDRFIEAPHTGAQVRISTLSGRSDYVGARRYA